jgi:hypothetical protein
MFTSNNRSKLPIAVFTCFMVASLALNYKIFQDGLSSLSNWTLRASMETAHGDITLFAAGALEPEIRELMRIYSEQKQDISWDKFMANVTFRSFDNKVRRLFRNTDVLKVKLYATDGVTIFSTDPSQVGENKAEIHEVTHALRGRPYSQFSFRDKFVGISSTLNKVEVVSSYHPIYLDNNVIIGVAELYSNVAETFVRTQSRSDTRVAYSILSLTSTLTVWIVFLVYNSIQQRKDDFES